ncbi:hypothetical protein [Gemmata sp.]|uniref:hypothetical protein n=1 Tax=Gemmata sp. TaxID=1914242 RepID=UPI003F721BB3
MKQAFNTWAFWRFPGFVAWTWTIEAIWRIFSPESLPPQILWAIGYPLAIGAYHLLTQRPVKACHYGLYLVFFPAVIVTIILRSIYNRFNGIYRALNRISSPYLSPLYLAIVVIAVLVLATMESEIWIEILSCVIIFINTLLIANAIRWAINPMKPIDIIAHLLHALCVQFKGKTKDEQTAEQIKKGMENLRSVYTFLSPILNRLEKHVASTITAAFVLYFGFLFWVTVLSFASVYSSLARLGEEHYHGLSSNFYECLLYSISVLTTSPLAGSDPLSLFAKTVFCLELLSTVSLITLFVSIFAVGFGMQDGSIDSIKLKVANIRTHFDGELERYNDFSPGRAVAEVTADHHSTQSSPPVVISPTPIVAAAPPPPPSPLPAVPPPAPKPANGNAKRPRKKP